MVSTISSAGMAGGVDRLADLVDREVSSPVEVSLWTTQTALIVWAVSARAGAPRCAAGSTPGRQSLAMNSGFEAELGRPCSSTATAKWPVSYISTVSPGDSVLTSAASQAPVPDAG